MFYKGNQTCANKGFIAWDGSQAPNPKPEGSDKIPVKADSYCCDLWA